MPGPGLGCDLTYPPLTRASRATELIMRNLDGVSFKPPPTHHNTRKEETVSPIRTQLNSAIPPGDYNHDIPHIHQLHQVKYTAPSSCLAVIIAILICNTVGAFYPPGCDVMGCIGDVFVGSE